MNVHVPYLTAETRLGNDECFWLGVHVAHHRSTEAIAELVKLPGGAAQATALAMEWGYPIRFRPESDFMSVGLSGRHRTKLAEEARTARWCILVADEASVLVTFGAWRYR